MASSSRSVWPLLALSALAVVGFRLVASLDRQSATGRAATGAFGTAKSTDEPHTWQQARAMQPDRGRDAAVPWQIPWRGWKDIFWRVYQEISDDRLLAVAAGVVFYGLLALFPAITAVVSLYGLFAKASDINQHLSLAAGLLPAGAFEIVEEQVNRIVQKGDAKLGFGFVFGLGLALWSANAGMKAIIDALNVVYDETEKRSFIKLNLVSLAFTIGAIAALFVAIGAVVVFPLVLAQFGLGSFTEILVAVLRWPVLFLMVMTGLALLYRYGPSRTRPRWQWLMPGTVFAAVAWLAVSALLSWYLSNFADYDATYGSLGAAIGLMIWMWASTTVILVGAEINAEIEHQTACDSTVGPEKPLGARGAAMADTVGAAAG
jgi:membrane protein